MKSSLPQPRAAGVPRVYLSDSDDRRRC